MAENMITLIDHIMREQQQRQYATGEFSGLMAAISLAGKLISREVSKAGLGDALGSVGQINVQGEEVQKLDAFAQDTITRIIRRSGHVAIMASEEMADPILCPGHEDASYVVAFDPLDGSSNIDANVSIGTVFGIYRRATPHQVPSERDVLRKGRSLSAAGYLLYGSCTMFVYSTNEGGVHGFTLDPQLGEFLLTHPSIRIPKKCHIYSTNEGNSPWWQPGMRRFMDWVKTPDSKSRRPWSSRYIGSMVADIHRNLLYGGIFLYPPDSKDPNKPDGKLRLLYEAIPMAYLTEAAGGSASDGSRPILDIEPRHLHQRVPLIVGPRSAVERYEAFVSESSEGHRE